MYFVYILWSDSLNRFYIGQCNDVQRRLEEHNAGHNLSTKAGIPWTLMWHTQKPDRAAAMSLERKLKNLHSSERIRAFISKYSQ